jgi:hypothetical protein
VCLLRGTDWIIKCNPAKVNTRGREKERGGRDVKNPNNRTVREHRLGFPEKLDVGDNLEI